MRSVSVIYWGQETKLLMENSEREKTCMRSSCTYICMYYICQNYLIWCQSSLELNSLIHKSLPKKREKASTRWIARNHEKEIRSIRMEIENHRKLISHSYVWICDACVCVYECGACTYEIPYMAPIRMKWPPNTKHLFLYWLMMLHPHNTAINQY